MATGSRYVQVTLLVEESGILDSEGDDDRYATRMYTLSDPSGILDGDLELICTEAELDKELRNLNAIPVVAKQVSVARAATTTSSTSSTPIKYVGNSQARKRAIFEAPTNVSAGGLVNDLAEKTGTRGVWTTLLADLVDDLLRPQK